MTGTTKKATKAQLFFYGCVGAIAPDIVQLYAKRWTMPMTHFSIEQYLIVSAFYVALGGILGMLFAYQEKPQAAVAVGIATPVVIGILGSAVKGAMTPVRGESEIGTIFDLISFP